MLRRGLGLVVAVVIAIAGTLGAPVAHPAAESTARAASSFADPGFREIAVFSGLDHPTTVRFASDGRAFVAEKKGVVKAYSSLTDTTPTTVLDISGVVNRYWDRGLLGIAVDPKFLAGRPYLYIFYVYDAPPGRTAPVWNDVCPTPPGPTADGCVVTSKLERVTVDPATNKATARLTLLHDWCQQFPSHSGGGIAIGPDGQLYFSGGDGASIGGADWGQFGGTLPDPSNPVTPVNPCDDPVDVTSAAGAPPTVDAVTAEGGSLRTQDVRTTGDPTGLDGALIRVNPDTGKASTGNPLAGVADADANAKRIVAHGLRNPFRLTFRPGTGEIYIGDVGRSTWEEIERITVPGTRTLTTLPNFGWPCYEGPGKFSPWSTMGNAMCDGLYQQGAGAVTAPLYTYKHTGIEYPCGQATSSGAAVSGLAFYQASKADQTVYPGKYNGALFFVDYSRKCLAALLPGANGVPDPAKMVVVGTGLANPTDLTVGPHGDLYYPDYDGGRIMRLRNIAAPVAIATATPDEALASAQKPVVVTLDGSGSKNQDPATTLTYAWDLDHDGTFGGPADKTGATVAWTIATAAVWPITFQVSSSNGTSDMEELVIDTTNDPPVPHIATPSSGLTWSVGDEITFSGHGADAQDGDPMPDAALTWTLAMEHCSVADCHEHIIETFDGVASGSFVAPDHEYPSHLQLRLAATDAHGTTRTTSVDLQPKTATIGLDSVPSGIPLSADGTFKTSPSTTTLIRGGTTTVAASLARTVSGKRYRFTGWSDALPRTHDVTVVTDANLTATYVPDAPDTCATAISSTKDTWIAQRTSGESDEDWFSFTLSTKRRVIVTLGSLPVDATLRLYGSCSTLLATSAHTGNAYEEITRRLGAGTYRVRVTAGSTASNPTAWQLRFRALTNPFHVKSTTVTHPSSTSVRIAGEVINNSGSTRGPITVTAKFKDAKGNVVATLKGTTFAYRLGDGSVTPFVVSGTVPAYSTISYSETAATALRSTTLELTSLTRTANTDGTVTETGVVKNAGTSSVSSARAARTWYGTRGQVLDFRTAAVSPSTLAPGASGGFTILRPVLGTVQRTRTQLRAQ